MKRIYSVPDTLDVFHDDQEKYIILKWTSFDISLEEIKKMHAEILTYAVSQRCYIFVADTSKTISALSESILKWWNDEWINTLVKNGIEMIITILPMNAKTQLSTLQWQKGNYGTIRMENVLLLEQVNYLVREHYRNKT